MPDNFLDQILNYLGGQFAQTAANPQPMGDPNAAPSMIQQQPMTSGAPSPIGGNAPMGPSGPAITPPQSPGLVDALTRIMSNPLVQGTMGSLAGGFGQGRHATAGQRAGGAIIGGLGGFNQGQNIQQNQAYQQAIEQRIQEQIAMQQQKEQREAALEKQRQAALQEMPEADRPYYALGQKPPVQSHETESDLAYLATHAKTPEDRKAAQDSLDILAKAKEKARAPQRITKEQLAYDAQNAGTPEERDAAAKALKGLQDADLARTTALEKIKTQGSITRAGIRSAATAKKEGEADKKQEERDKKTVQTQVISYRRQWMSANPVLTPGQKVDQSQFSSWLQEADPSLYQDAAKYGFIPKVKEGTAGPANDPLGLRKLSATP